MASDFFISYTGEDRVWAEWIAWQLEAAGYTATLQAWDFRPGRDWAHEMQEATTGARRTVPLLSPDYVHSAHGEAEWRVAYKNDPSGEKGLLIPVRILQCDPPGVLSTRVYIDLVGLDEDNARDALLLGVRDQRAKPTREPAFPGRRPPSFPWERWGPLAERYQGRRPRKILALDGGGIRGIITLGVLQRLEEELRNARGADSDFRLCDFFDLIGGTSTGAIIAAALARGMSVKEIDSFYRAMRKTAFARRTLRPISQSLDKDELGKTLQDMFGSETDLRPENLRCLLVVVTRNATTDSAWPITSNPFAKYNDPTRPDCNLRIPLWRLLRANAGVSVLSPPEVVGWEPYPGAASRFVFADGGTTPYHNPAFLLFKMATEPAYRLGWPIGERNLLLVSVGTGGAPLVDATADDTGTDLLEEATNTLSALMSQASIDQDISCRVIGRCNYGGFIDRELYDLTSFETGVADQPLPLATGTDKAFVYVRYNAELTLSGLGQLGLSAINTERIRKMDDVENLADLTSIGAGLADRVDLAHLGSFATE